MTTQTATNDDDGLDSPRFKTDDELIELLGKSDPYATELVRRKQVAMIKAQVALAEATGTHAKEIGRLERMVTDARDGKRAARFFLWVFLVLLGLGGIVLTAAAIVLLVQGRIPGGTSWSLIALGVVGLVVTLWVSGAKA